MSAGLCYFLNIFLGEFSQQETSSVAMRWSASSLSYMRLHIFVETVELFEEK
jgi:hypothetical protein